MMARVIPIIMRGLLGFPLVNEINKNVDIPLLSEKTEAKVFDALWDSVEEVLKKAILKG